VRKLIRSHKDPPRAVLGFCGAANRMKALRKEEGDVEDNEERFRAFERIDPCCVIWL